MAELTYIEIIIRLSLSIIFSGLIGYEREISSSSAGLKTHILVGIGSTIVALIQIDTIALVTSMSPDINVSVDAVRLIAQVVSGIGFLGAGTIIITKRSILGLTTAASIWGVASIGLALGMGYYEIAVIGSSLTLLVLVIFKRFVNISSPQNIIIKYISSESSTKQLNAILEEYDKDHEVVRMSTSNYRNHLIITKVIRSGKKGDRDFSELVDRVSEVKNIVSIESSELD